MSSIQSEGAECWASAALAEAGEGSARAGWAGSGTQRWEMRQEAAPAVGADPGPRGGSGRGQRAGRFGIGRVREPQHRELRPEVAPAVGEDAGPRGGGCGGREAGEDEEEDVVG